MNSVRQILEIDKILEQVSLYIKTKRGINIIEKLDVFDSKELLADELKRTSEMDEIINKLNDLPIVSRIDILEEIKKAKKGEVLDEYILNQIKDELISVKDIIKFYSKLNTKPELLDEYFKELFFDESLWAKINNVISSENTVLDSASPKLHDIRRQLEKADRELKTSINKLLLTYKDQLSGDNYVMRNGTYALPVNTSFKNSVEGIVLDISDSGLTTFIQPSLIVNLENNKHILEIQEREEVSRILKELTYLVVSKEKTLVRNSEIVGYFDFLNAKVRFLHTIEGTIPTLTKNQEIKLYSARHPLLPKENVVSNDFVLGNEKTLMLISGPNAGGKTIALKTVATLAYMTKLGLPIPAAQGSEIGFFRKIYVDIGDGQSIENNLSTFSAHISVLSVLLKYISSKDLVVIDELGNGTDPKEGEALSMSVVEYLIERKCMTLITSHYSLLKQFGLNNKNVLSASFIFNEDKIEPTFRIIYDVTGKSFGFAIAKKYGLNESVVNRAKEIYESNYIDKNDRKLQILEDKERAIFEKNQQLNEKRRELDQFNAELKKKKDNLDLREEKLKEHKIQDFDDYVDSKIEEIDDIVEEFKKSNKQHSNEYIKKLSKVSLTKKEQEPIEVGDYVNVRGLEVEGKVVLKDGKKIHIVTRDGMTIKSSLDSVEKVATPKEYKTPVADVDKLIFGRKSVSQEINLIGLHIDEALPYLDKYLSDAYSRGFKTVRVIHGFGSGQLRQAVHTHLKTLKFVKSFRLSTEGSTSGGSTLVDFN